MRVPNVLFAILEIAVVIIIMTGSTFFRMLLEPVKRGFFCSDESLKYPFKKSIIPGAALLGCSIGIPTMVILVVERYIIHRSQTSLILLPKVCCRHFRVSSYVTACYKYIIRLVFTVQITLLLTQVGKYSIGRLRPHFFDLCNIDVSKFNCSHGYIESYTCNAKVPSKMKDVWLSFPSGHASVSAAAMIYTALYVQFRVKSGYFQIHKLFYQSILIGLAIFAGCSRVADYNHHWSDVLAGFALGTAVSFCVIFGSTQTRDSTNGARSKDIIEMVEIYPTVAEMVEPSRRQ